MITVAPGANHEVGDTEVAAGGPIRRGCPRHLCRDPGAGDPESSRPNAGTGVLNLAPAPADAAAIVAGGVDWLVVNEGEAVAVLGRPVGGLAEAAQAAAALIGRAPGTPWSRPGAHGAALATAGRHGAARPPPAPPRTPPRRRGHHRRVPHGRGGRHRGRGDAFVGALAVALAAGVPAAEAVRAAAAAGATAATRPGAQLGCPVPRTSSPRPGCGGRQVNDSQTIRKQGDGKVYRCL